MTAIQEYGSLRRPDLLTHSRLPPPSHHQTCHPHRPSTLRSHAPEEGAANKTSPFLRIGDNCYEFEM
jgi:hypothetical protein